MERRQSNDEEWKKLPEEPQKLTYRGRYTQLDNYIIQRVLGLDKVEKPRRVKVLDFAGGVLDFGSPTAHDLVDAIQSAGHQPEVVVIDQDIPENLEPSYPQVSYSDKLTIAKGKFNIIRVLRLQEHVNGEEYERIRRQLVRRLKEGGLFISSQQMGYWKRDSYGTDLRKSPQIIKIMQMQQTELVPLSIFPESSIPYTVPFLSDDQQYREAYDKFRENVQSGREDIEKDLAREGYKSTVRDLINADPRVFESEHADTISGYYPMNWMPRDQKGLPLFVEMGRNKHRARELFQESLPKK